MICRDVSAGMEGRKVSQFRKPLGSILHDRGPLSTLEYWIQFLISRNGLHLLQFWFSVDSFKNASSSFNKCPPPRPLAAASNDIRQMEWAAVDCLATAGPLVGHGDSERVTSDSSCKASVCEGIPNSNSQGKMEPQSLVELQAQEAGTNSSTLNGVGRKLVVDSDMTKESQSNARGQEPGGELARQISLSESSRSLHYYHLRQCILCQSACVHTIPVNVYTC